MIDKDSLRLDIYEYVKYDDEAMKMTDKKIIDEIKRINDLDIEKLTPDEETLRETMKNELAQRFGLVSQTMLDEWQKDVMENIAEAINENTADMKSHRHDKSKSFTSKPEFG